MVDASTIGGVLPDASLVRLKQVHSATVMHVDDLPPWSDDARPEADALVTAQPGCLLAIVTADCAPVLLADVQAGIVGAAHAGWRGARSGVLENTVAAMADLGADPSRIVAAIGPTIAQQSYEVDDVFRTQFGPHDEAFFVPGQPGHYHFDLPAYAAARLRRSGVLQIEDLREDTYAQPERFHSFRRGTHLHQPSDGRQVSVIGRASPVA